MHCVSKCHWKNRSACCSKPSRCLASRTAEFNPHFLFNSSQLRCGAGAQPARTGARDDRELAADVLGALLKDHDAYVRLREELKFTDDYLDIEVVRFGAEKLRVEKEINRALSIFWCPASCCSR